jgi:hypothetical protein
LTSPEVNTNTEEYRDCYEAANDILGYCGQMLSGSKQERPGQRIVWNANVCVKSRGKIWYGDIDLIRSADALHTLAAELGEAVFVLREHDARFKNEAKPLYDEAVEKFEAVS